MRHAPQSKSKSYKNIVQGKPEGRRCQGRPKAALFDNIKEWNGLKSHQVFQAPLDRDGCRKIDWEALQAANAHPDDAG